MAETLVTVRGLTGETILGPELFQRESLILKLRARLLQGRLRQVVTIIQNSRALTDHSQVEDDLLCLTATFAPKLAEQERLECLDRLARATKSSQYHNTASIVWDVLASASQAARDDPTVMLAAMATCGQSEVLRYSDETLRSDRTFMLEAVQLNGYALEYAGDDLKSDRDVVLQAVKSTGIALGYASEQLRCNRDVVLAAVAKDGDALGYTSKDLQADREIVQTAVATDAYALECASLDLRNDRGIVLTAVRQMGHVLQYASKELRAEREIVETAVRQYAGALAFASDELKNDRTLVLVAVASCGLALEHASVELRGDRQVVLAAMQEDRGGNALTFASGQLQAELMGGMDLAEARDRWLRALSKRSRRRRCRDRGRPGPPACSQ